MKNTAALFLALLTLVFCFASCDSRNKEIYTSMIADSVNDKCSVDAEIDYWTGIYFKKENMDDKSCIVLDNSYSGSYSKSIIDKMNSYTTDIYVDENDIEFGLRNDTGELTFINFMNADFFATQPYLPETSAPYETAILSATKIASKYIDNITDYTQITEEPVTRYKERDGITYEITYYVVTFARKIHGYFSSDYISIKVTSKGTVASIMIGDIGVFDDATIDFESTFIDQSIENKMKSVYKENGFKVKKFNVDEQKIVLTPSGDICMYSEIVVDIMDVSNIETKTGVSILTILGEKQK